MRTLGPAVAKPNIITRIVLTVLLIVILEGGVRKWIWSDATFPLLAIRDGLVFYGVIAGFRRRWFQTAAGPEVLLMMWTAAVCLLTVTQSMMNLQQPLVALLGLGSWLLYVWFALLCGRTLSLAQVEYILKYVGLILVPMAALAFAQHWLPPGYVINRQADASGEAGIFTVVGNIVRVTGTFSCNSGYGFFVMLAGVPALGILAREFDSIRRSLLRWLFVLSFIICVMVISSCGTNIISVILTVSLLISSVTRRKRKNTRSSAAIIAVDGLGAIAARYLFERAIIATESRFETAARSESMADRIITSLVGSEAIRDDFTSFGHSIGLGNNAAGVPMGGRQVSC